MLQLTTYASPLLSGNRYKAGETRSEDPEEERKQKEFKGILNKLTPDNFEKLLQKVGSMHSAFAQRMAEH